MRTALGVAARMLTGGRGAALVGVGLMVTAVAQDGARAVDGQSQDPQPSLTLH